MTSESPATPQSEDEMGTQVSRLVKPLALFAPLMLIALVPAALYGQRSRSVAAEADRTLVASFTTLADGPAMVLDAAALCDATAADTLATTFAEVDLGGENHKASVTGLGFDTVTVDLEGRVEDTPGPDRDNIAIRLERDDDGWCIADISTPAPVSR